jgi:hypothetical protein
LERQLEAYQKIERSIIKKFRKQLWTPFIVAVKRYELIQAGDKIAVCISGGKDSMVMAKLLQELQRHSEVPFELVFLVMDPGYNEINRQKIESNAALLHIPITVFETNIFDVANNSDKSPCYLCARMRRGHLYKKAQQLGCNKIALGHHFNDMYPMNSVSHRILVNEGTRLGKILGKETAGVNSFHHQAVREPGTGFIISAVSTDGVTEAIEMEGSRFVAATQWHPEMMHDSEEQQAIFRAFVEACRVK